LETNALSNSNEGSERKTHRRGGSKKDKHFRGELNKVLNEIVVLEERGEKGEVFVRKIKKIRRVAEALVEKAMLGDTTAIEIVATRMDGRVPQSPPAVAAELPSFRFIIEMVPGGSVGYDHSDDDQDT
jgi:hypothetical protein